MHLVRRILSSPHRASRRLGLFVTALAAAAALGVPLAFAGTLLTFDELNGTGNPIVTTITSQGYTFSLTAFPRDR